MLRKGEVKAKCAGIVEEKQQKELACALGEYKAGRTGSDPYPLTIFDATIYPKQ